MKLPLALAMAMPLIACGGSTRNAPLSKQVQTAHMAPISAAERASEADAKRAVFVAQWQLAFTQGQIDGAVLEVKIAKNDLAKAKLTLKSAKIESAAAEKVGDTNRIDRAQKAEAVASLAVEVHNLAITRAKLSNSYLKKRLIQEEKIHRSEEANLEYVRAELLNSATIQPPKFNRKGYKSQRLSRQAEVNAGASSVSSAQGELAAIETKLASARARVAAAKRGSKGGSATVKTPEVFSEQPEPPKTPPPAETPPTKPVPPVPTEPANETGTTPTAPDNSASSAETPDEKPPATEDNSIPPNGATP